MKKSKPRQYKILSIAPDIVAALGSGTYRVCANELPDDARIVSRSYDAHTDSFQLIIESDSFPPVPLNRAIPTLDSPSVERLPDQIMKLVTIASAAFKLLDGEYGELCGQIVAPWPTDGQRAKLRRLADALHDAGYNPMILT